MRPSPNLSWAELECHDAARTAYPARWRDTRLPKLARAFETIRAIWGKPIRVTSSYRTPDYNRSIGGAKLSQHCFGRALDLMPPEGVSVKDFAAGILRVADEVGIGGVGIGSDFVHVDIRPRKADGKLAQWTY